MVVQVALWPRGIKRVKSAGPLGVTWTGTGNTARTGNPVFATDIGELVSVSHSTRYEDGFGGDDLSKFKLKPNGGYVGGMFRPGDHVRISRGGGKVADVELSEVVPQGDGTVDFNCKGHAYNLEDYDSIYVASVGSASYPTTRLMKSVGYTPSADLFGWEWAQSIGMPINQVVGDVGPMRTWYGESWASPEPVKIGTVLTEVCRSNGVRWAVWGRTLVLAAETTTTKWAMDAPEGLVGTASTDYYTRVGVTYIPDSLIPPNYSDATVYAPGSTVVYQEKWYQKRVASVAGIDPTETVSVGGVDVLAWGELPRSRSVRPSDLRTVWAVQDTDGINLFDEKTTVIDVRDRGAIPTAQANTLAATVLTYAKGRFVVNGSFTVGRDSGFKSAAGGFAGDSLAFVKAGDGMRINHLRTTQGNVLPGFQVIGKTDWSWDAADGGDGQESLTITPMGAPPRNIANIVASIPLGRY